MGFKREDRYLVLKRKDLVILNPAQQAHLFELADKVRRLRGPKLECLVIESDWPEYEPAWEEIQRRVEGRPTIIDEELATLRDLERSYSQRLGEMARLADVVCTWVMSRDADPPSKIWEVAEEIMHYVDEVRPPEGSNNPEWVVHILGPDDVIPCMSQFEALRKANDHNKAFAKLMADDPSPNNPYCVALVKNRSVEEL